MDKKDFIQFYNEYVDKIYRFIYFRVDSEETAQDLASEVFLRTWQNLQKAPKIINSRAFLYQTTRNLLTDFYRRKSNFEVTLASAEFDPGQLPDKANLVDKINFDLEFEQVRKALNNIQPEQQEAVMLRYLDELEMPEIAQILGKSEGAVRVLLHRGLTALRKFLGT